MIKTYILQPRLLTVISLLLLQSCSVAYAEDSGFGRSIFADPQPASTPGATSTAGSTSTNTSPSITSPPTVIIGSPSRTIETTETIELKPHLNKPVLGVPAADSSMTSTTTTSETTTTTTTSSPSEPKPYVKLAPEVVPEQTVRSTTSSTKTVQTKSTSTTDAQNAEIDSAIKSILSDRDQDYIRLRRDKKSARKIAKSHWLDKAAAANPGIIEAITRWKGASTIVARHPRLAAIADADHYLCRRLTKWKSVARVLCKNGQVKTVIDYDPEGIYYAVRRDKKIIRILAKNPSFDQMIVDNPDLGRELAKHL
jgi:hypothetical protein